MSIERIKPGPVPQIFPHWEYKAEGELYDTYEAYKTALQIPWVGVVTMAYAHYRPFFNSWWGALEPVVKTKAYVDASFTLKENLEANIKALNPPPITERLVALGYSSRELSEIRNMIDVITHGNFMQLAAVCAARLLLEGGELEGGPVGESASERGFTAKAPFVLIEPHHALADQTAIYEDIKTTLGLPFINTDYRCFSRWPSYFNLAWADLRKIIPTDPYENFVLNEHNALYDAVKKLPNPTGLTADTLKRAASQNGQGKDVLETVRLFSWLLPGLVTNVAYFRAQLLA